MSAPASAATVAMDASFNHPPSVELFNGSGDITSWLKKFRRAYRRANGNRDPGPSDLIQAMDSALTGDAATFVGNSTLLSHIVDQADKFAATTEDLALFESTLQDHYVVKTEVGIGCEDRGQQASISHVILRILMSRDRCKLCTARYLAMPRWHFSSLLLFSAP
ncbi:hypothetical protein E4U49_007319 [Claviceps purpurea]|nr:hypothetical protein E4U49_007319 [Claviceps purpurea]